jgi:hypothetical protein
MQNTKVLENFASFIKGLLPPLVRDYLGACYDCYRKPCVGDPFNGQVSRQKAFTEIADKCRLSAIIETGTFRGGTTEFFLKNSEAPVYTCEIMRRYYLYSRMRLSGFRKCQMFCMDSREFLNLLLKSPDVPKRNVFFYLDAHWYKDLPLFSEVSIICSNWKDPIIMIDDFAVPGDPGYKFDDYGNGEALNTEYLSALIKKFDLKTYFPTLHSSKQEEGFKRGYVVLSMPGAVTNQLDSIASIKKWSPDRGR